MEEQTAAPAPTDTAAPAEAAAPATQVDEVTAAMPEGSSCAKAKVRPSMANLVAQ